MIQNVNARRAAAWMWVAAWVCGAWACRSEVHETTRAQHDRVEVEMSGDGAAMRAIRARIGDETNPTDEDVEKLLFLPSGEIERLLKGKRVETPEEEAVFQKQFEFEENGEGSYIHGDSRFRLISTGIISQIFQAGRGDGEVSLSEVLQGLPEEPGRSADWTNRQTAVRNQGDRNTCVAFAACAELESIVLVEHKTTVEMSKNLASLYLAEACHRRPCDDPCPQATMAPKVLRSRYLYSDQTWEYCGTAVATLKASKQCGKIEAAPGARQNEAQWRVGTYAILPTAGEAVEDGSPDIRDTKTLRRLLDGGHCIVIACVLSWTDAESMEVIDLIAAAQNPTQPRNPKRGHALLLTGYEMPEPENGKPFFWAKNSWGPEFGVNGGYLKLSFDYIRMFAKYGYITLTVTQKPPGNE